MASGDVLFQTTAGLTPQDLAKGHNPGSWSLTLQGTQPLQGNYSEAVYATITVTSSDLVDLFAASPDMTKLYDIVVKEH